MRVRSSPGTRLPRDNARPYPAGARNAGVLARGPELHRGLQRGARERGLKRTSWEAVRRPSGRPSSASSTARANGPRLRPRWTPRLSSGPSPWCEPRTTACGIASSPGRTTGGWTCVTTRSSYSAILENERPQGGRWNLIGYSQGGLVIVLASQLTTQIDDFSRLVTRVVLVGAPLAGTMR